MPINSTMTVLDLSGLKCPLPVLRTRKALKGLAVGGKLEIRCTDPLAAIDIPALIHQTGDRVRTLSQNKDYVVFLIEKLGGDPPQG